MGHQCHHNFCLGLASDNAGRVGVQPDGPVFQPAVSDQVDNDAFYGGAYIIGGIIHNITAAPSAQVRQVQIFLDDGSMGVVPGHNYFPRFNTGVGCPDTFDARKISGVLGNAENEKVASSM